MGWRGGATCVIDVAASVELLHQAGADPNRLDLAEAFIIRRALDAEHMSRRIEENAEGRLHRDARVLEKLAAAQI